MSTEHTDPDRWAEAEQLDRATGVTDDQCHGRCSELLPWFTWETRGLMEEGEAHNVLDMLLNRLASDQRLLPEGASVVEQLGVRVDVAHPGRPEKVGDVITHWGDATRGAPQYWHGWTLVRRDTADWHGPWTPVVAALEPVEALGEQCTTGGCRNPPTQMIQGEPRCAHCVIVMTRPPTINEESPDGTG